MNSLTIGLNKCEIKGHPTQLKKTGSSILSVPNQYEMKDIGPTPEEVINVSGKNRGWIYQIISKMSKKEAVL